MFMWVCGYCATKSFMERSRCFGCGKEKPSRIEIVEEQWRKTALGNAARTGGGEMGAKGRGKESGGKGGRSGKEKGRVEDDGHGGGFDGAEWIGLEPGQRWADAGGVEGGLFVDGGARKGGARPMEGKKSYKEAVEGRTGGKAVGKGSASAAGQNREGKDGKGKTEEKGGGADTGRRTREALDERDDGGDLDGKRLESTEEQVATPVELPPLPRKWLVGRLAELERCVERLPADDPRATIAEQRLQRARGEVRLAGGRTSKRLFFSLAGGVDRIGRAEKAPAEAEEKVERLGGS